MLDAELRTKRESFAAPVTALEDALAANAERKIGADAGRTVHLAASHLAARLASNAGTDVEGYMRHALRVARITLEWDPRPSAETMALAVLHNVQEVASSDEIALAGAGISPHVIAGIRALTIDRPRDEDPAYLGEFYSAIVRAGPDVALVRCADKIDNLIDFDVSSGDPRRVSYVDLAERFVLPIAHGLSERLGLFFASVIQRTRGGWGPKP